MLKAEFIPPAPIRGEKGASEGTDKGRLRGDSMGLALAKEPDSLCSTEGMGDTSGFGDTILEEEAEFGPEEAADTVDTHFTGEPEGKCASQGIGDVATRVTGDLGDVEGFERLVAGLSEALGGTDDVGGREGREGEEEELAGLLKLVPLT